MPSVRPLAPDAHASVPVQPAPGDGAELTPAALRDMRGQEPILTEMAELASRVRPRSRFDRFLGRHPQLADRLAIETVVTRRSVAALLDGLGHGSTALHDVPGPDGEVVHNVLIGPSGVFVIAVLEVPSRLVLVLHDDVLVDGRSTDVLARLDAQARLVGERLGLRAEQVTPRPVLVVNGYRHLSVRQGSHTTVVSVRGLREWLDRRAPALTPQLVADLVARAADPQTWGLDAAWAVAAPRPESQAVFDRLVATVRRARRTRWALRFGAGLAALDLVIAGWTWWG